MIAIFEQILNPTRNLALTILVALAPLIFLLFMLAVLRVTAWLSCACAGALTFALGLAVWHAPAGSLLKSYLYGAMTGIWTIDWITFWGFLIFNTLVLTGNFERFKNWLVHHATADVRIQTIILAWSFGALLEGLVGFGYPWAVVVPILIGLGITDLDAIRVAALANNAPVSFGAFGAPLLSLAAVTGLPLQALSASVGNIVAILALLPPWVLIYLVSGWEGVSEAWPLAVVGSLSYIAGQWPVAHFLGPYLPDLSGSLVSFWTLFLFVKLWRPKTLRGFGGVALAVDPPVSPNLKREDSLRETFAAWMPYFVIIFVTVAWTLPYTNLPSKVLFRLSVVAKSSVTQGNVTSAFAFNPLPAGTAVLVAWLVILAILHPGMKVIWQAFSRTFRQMWGALLVAPLVFALAYVFVYCGMANSLAYALSKIGWFFVVLAPILGWIGVALSGSNTTTNAMFGPVQAVTGRLLNLPILLLPSFNSVGAEIGKPIAPQTASVGASTSKFVRSEGQVIRHNMGWTLIMLAYLILLSLLFYFVFPHSMVL